MTEEQAQVFFDRIDLLTSTHLANWGKMNVHQMVCHCTDLIRLATGGLKAHEYGKVDPAEMIALAKARKPVPTPKGLDQVKGEGTAPCEFEADKKLLKSFISSFVGKSEEYVFFDHPYFGKLSKKEWSDLIVYHLNHHLKQFNV